MSQALNFQITSFLTSAAKLSQCPEDNGREVAFIGRSNAGKSSALNLLTQQKNLARVSKTPGRTQLLNFFTVTENCRLVDLPGYGYAKVPQAIKENWRASMTNYLEKRQSLAGLILLMDIRHPLTPYDEQMVNFTQFYKIPLHILLTKSDKLSRSQGLNTLKQIQNKLQQQQKITLQLFSATKRIGLEELKQVVTQWLLDS
ncbi:MAG: ribosome biogenesis GTP-binding protein YihA/YsxC [Pseudomonadota bacterium]